jgi:hypothetical protein
MNLRLDWATHQAAKYACENWHYSRCLPKSKLVKIGVWEEQFIGVVIFGLGATPYLSKPYGLTMTECCELVRIALTKHKAPVSRIMAISIKFLKKKCPGIRLIVSFADANQNHHGGIYQATNWIYTGVTGGGIFYEKDGKMVHGRTLVHGYGTRSIETAKKHGYKIIRSKGKHRYLMPLDDMIRDRVKILTKPYPKRVGSNDNVAPVYQTGEDGASPIPTLHQNDID